MFLRQFLENLNEASNENQRRGNINPECRRRNAKWRCRQSKHDDTDLLETAQENLQRWRSPRDFEREESMAASQGKQSDWSVLSVLILSPLFPRVPSPSPGGRGTG